MLCSPLQRSHWARVVRRLELGDQNRAVRTSEWLGPLEAQLIPLAWRVALFALSLVVPQPISLEYFPSQTTSIH